MLVEEDILIETFFVFNDNGEICCFLGMPNSLSLILRLIDDRTDEFNLLSIN